MKKQWLILMAVLWMAGCQAAEGPVTDKTAAAAETEEEMQGETAPAAPPEDREITAEAKACCGTYFQAGNYERQLEVLPGERLHRNRLMVMLKEVENGDWQSAILDTYRLELKGVEDRRWQNVIQDTCKLDYDPGTPVYTMEGQDGAGSELKVTFLENGAIQAELIQAGEEGALDAGQVNGTYYPTDSLFCPELLTRPVNAADTNGLTKAELKILRNQYYAILGRGFDSPELSAYFEQQPWYRETVSPEDFSEERLSGLFRRNIAFLKEQEDMKEDEDAAAYKETWEGLPETPYQSLLPDSGEIWVTFLADAEKAEDRGIYYEVPGEIALPVTMTGEEYEQVMEQGKTVILTLDALNGKQAVAARSDNPNYGDCMLTALEEGEAGNGEPDYYFLSYELDKGSYSLWHSSADTLFCPVYEGPVCVLKGAEEEYGNYFTMDGNRSAQVPGVFRRIRYEAEDAGNTSDYFGNKPVFDEKGYLKALYYFGD